MDLTQRHRGFVEASNLTKHVSYPPKKLEKSSILTIPQTRSERIPVNGHSRALIPDAVRNFHVPIS